jgi:hypothetical protein
MKRRSLIGASAVVLLGVLGNGIAGAAPAPKYTIACAVGFNTTAKWQHAKLSRVAFHWMAPAGSSATFLDRTVTVTRKAPHGSAFSTTPPSGIDGVDPDRVAVSFTRVDGSGTDTVEAGCS